MRRKAQERRLEASDSTWCGFILVGPTFNRVEEAKSDCLGQLSVTAVMVAKKIKAMKDNKSPRVDGIPPKLQMETVEQISTCKSVQLVIKRGSCSV